MKDDKHSRKKKFILVLSGGFANGGFQAGALKYIHKQGLTIKGKKHFPNHFDAIFTISAGGYNGVMTAMGKHDELYDLWHNIGGKPSEVYKSEFLEIDGEKIKIDTEAITAYLTEDLNFFQKAGMVFPSGRKKAMKKIGKKLKSFLAMADPSPLVEKLRRLVSLKDIKSDAFHAGFVSLTDGVYYNPSHKAFESDTQLRNAVLATGTIPVMFPPVDEIVTKEYTITNAVDGAIRNVTPLGDAVKYINAQQADYDYHFVVISCHTGKEEVMTKRPNVLSIAARSMYEIAMNEILQNDIDCFVQINSLVKQAKAKGVELIGKSGRALKHFKVKIIKPQRELGASHDFSRKKVLDTLSHGYTVAQSVDQNLSWE